MRAGAHIIEDGAGDSIGRVQHPGFGICGSCAARGSECCMEPGADSGRKGDGDDEVLPDDGEVWNVDGELDRRLPLHDHGRGGQDPLELVEGGVVSLEVAVDIGHPSYRVRVER